MTYVFFRKSFHYQVTSKSPSGLNRGILSRSIRMIWCYPESNTGGYPPSIISRRLLGSRLSFFRRYFSTLFSFQPISYTPSWKRPTDPPYPDCHDHSMDTRHELQQAMWEMIAEMERARLKDDNDQTRRLERIA